ncbi:hypothetical protein [Candidatus Bodocaedibacter vickermanii]|uniref:LTXXQ motif family protein n=1 Tax=Candidatus Bodocaedibacter vickermanii TaxID=2741701 RepID=A0A7L9RU64_9PROT|nr:hypothetical protein CPBP_00928 [Candidatus Paracaedibacteraceae bacterium 'Lake Konstanz']
MKNTVFVLMTALLMTAPFAKALLSDEQQHRLVKLDRLENQAHENLQKAEQAALMGKISSNQLRAMRKQYEAAKEVLQAELSKLPNRAEIEQWLIDNHVGIGE